MTTDSATASGVAPTSITIAMLTYRRPADLVAAIPPVLAQFDAVNLPTRLLVVDNDPDGGAARTLADADFGDPGAAVEYVHEPRPGIAAARNRALQATPNHALLIFIDDDERPTDGWLAGLLATFWQHGCTAVVGPVVSEYEGVVEPWIAAGRFFDRRRLPTGTRTEVAATNNLLLDLDRVRALGLTFDETFGQSGGSDTLFTRTLSRAGHHLVWCDEAVVTDVVPASRLTRSWVLKRALRSGNSWIRTSLTLAGSPSERWAARGSGLGRGGIRLLGGLGRYLLGLATRSRRHQAKGLRSAARGAGMASAAVGYTYQEYRRHPAAAGTPSGATDSASGRAA